MRYAMPASSAKHGTEFHAHITFFEVLNLYERSMRSSVAFCQELEPKCVLEAGAEAGAVQNFQISYNFGKRTIFVDVSYYTWIY